MNMKKTFAGAMAGALAVSAMATSASASIPGPGEYTVDLTKEAEFFATVQFTFDNTYIVDKDIYEKGGNLELTFAEKPKAGEPSYFDLNGAKEVKVEVEGAKGTAKQTVIYNTTWNDVNFLDWNLFNWSGSTLKIPALANSNVAATKQSIYLDKFNTFNQAYATTTSAGSKIYPVVGTYDAATGKWTTTTTTDRDEKLDTTVIEKIVVTAKFPVKDRKFTLDALNAIGGYKDVVTASIKGLTNVDVYAVDNEEFMQATDRLKTALTAQTKIALYEDALKNVKKALDALNEELVKQKFLPVTSSADAKKAIGHSTGSTNTEGIAKIQDLIKALEAVETKANDYKTAIPAAWAGYTTITIKPEIERLQMIVDAYKDSLGVSTVGVEIAKDNTVVAETLFTKFESNRVGVKSGVIIDNKVVKTKAGDIGAWKPDALRIIADAIADNEGVTLTFTAKDSFDDAAYRSWQWGWMEYVENVIGGQNTGWKYAYNNHYDTESVKEDYEVWGESMFTGAIVLNRDFSKQFSQSNLVDWGTNTITFDWDELTEGRFYDASVVLHTMEILSTQNVEWVSCTVTVPEQTADAEDVAPSQGADDDSTVIDDTPVETEPAEVITEAPATEAPVTEAAPVAPVTNPTTGNAPVALAVIPVALAAAAIVAKKRG